MTIISAAMGQVVAKNQAQDMHINSRATTNTVEGWAFKARL